MRALHDEARNPPLPPHLRPTRRSSGRAERHPLSAWRSVARLSAIALGQEFVNINPRHLAAIQYTVITVFAFATWSGVLFPIDGARARLASMFAEGAAHRELFALIVCANALTAAMAAAFWFERAASPPLAPMLVCVSVALLAWALWWSNTTVTFTYALGCLFSVWSWRQPTLPLTRHGRRRAA